MAALILMSHREAQAIYKSCFLFQVDEKLPLSATNSGRTVAERGSFSFVSA